MSDSAAPSDPDPRVSVVYIPTPPPPPGGWENLFCNLLTVKRDQNFGLELPGSPPGFTAALNSLIAVIEFLGSSPELMSAQAVLPLMQLANALGDLDNGSRPALLALRPIRGRAPKETAEAHVIGFAARAMDRLMQSGLSADASAAKVCAAMKRGGAIGSVGISRAKVKTWRARCNEGDGADVPKGALQKFREPMFKLTPPPKIEAEMLLYILSDAKHRGLGIRISR